MFLVWISPKVVSFISLGTFGGKIAKGGFSGVFGAKKNKNSKDLEDCRSRRRPFAMGDAVRDQVKFRDGK